MNWLDRCLAWFCPRVALRRLRARQALARAENHELVVLKRPAHSGVSRFVEEPAKAVVDDHNTRGCHVEPWIPKRRKEPDGWVRLSPETAASARASGYRIVRKEFPGL